MDFNPTQQDVRSVQDILRRHLPAELTLDILDVANYYPRSRCHRNEPKSYKANDFWQPEPVANVAGLYLTSTPTPRPDMGWQKVKVNRVTFNLRSADQGWASFGGEDTYVNSHTWFDASILRPWPNNSDDAPGPAAIGLEASAIPQTFRTPADARGFLQQHGWDFVEHDQGLTWKVHNNITAQEKYANHRVDWVAGMETEVENPDAMGDGRGFLERLTPGCIIALWARAEVSQTHQNATVTSSYNI